MQKSEQKSNKREAVRTEMQKMRRKSFYFFLPVILVIFTGCSTSASKKTISEKKYGRNCGTAKNSSRAAGVITKLMGANSRSNATQQ